jgi:STE24 endopeptidase
VNLWGAVVLAGLLLQAGLDLVAGALNVRALRPELPAEFRGVYDPDRYRRAQEYTRARARFGMVAEAASLAAVIAFWFAHGFDALDRAVRALALGPVPTGLLFIAALALARVILALPFRCWSTFVTEERFGFNRTTPRTFGADLAKGFLLAALLGGPLVAAILWLFEAAGGLAWLWCWAAGALFVLTVQFVAPTWIMPLFNRFSPLPDGALREAILAYARSVAFPLQGVFVIDGSRRSTKANALFTGFGRHKRIALFDTLLATLDPGEIVAVVAHEIGHYKRRHVLKGLAIAVAQMGAVFFLLSLLLRSEGLFHAFFMQEPSVHAGLVLFALLLSPIDLVLSVVLHALSRRHEREADAFATQTTGSGNHLANALKRLSADSLANLTPHPLEVLLHYSHPPVLERVQALSA